MSQQQLENSVSDRTVPHLKNRGLETTYNHQHGADTGQKSWLYPAVGTS